MCHAISNQSNRRAGFTIVDCLVALLSSTALVAVFVPAVAATHGDVQLTVSLNNLRILGEAHVTYSHDWEGRQWTVTPDDLSDFIHGNYPDTYPVSGDAGINGRRWEEIPSIRLGFGCDGEYYETRRGWALQPMWYAGNCTLGNFRAWNTGALNQYVNGKVYDRTFLAPRNLSPPIDFEAYIGDYLDLDCEWPGPGTAFYFPTYCLSVAAQVDPEVYRGPQDGGSQRARRLPVGHRAPNLNSARYPDLKTHMLEHYWLNNWPAGHDPFIPGTNRVPWYYNMSDLSEPATLFFDGSVRLLPNLEVLASNDVVVRGGEDSLWAEDAYCFGSMGYFETYALPPSDSATYEFVDMVPSHHVFTRDGILGRDTILAGP